MPGPIVEKFTRCLKVKLSDRIPFACISSINYLRNISDIYLVQVTFPIKEFLGMYRERTVGLQGQVEHAGLDIERGYGLTMSKVHPWPVEPDASQCFPACPSEVVYFQELEEVSWQNLFFSSAFLCGK
jgi:hypothetical protein